MKLLVAIVTAVIFCSSLAFAKDPSLYSGFCATRDIAPLENRVKHSVKEYGAIGDGVTDDTAALQKAFDSAQLGEILILPKGKYLFSKSLRLSRDGVVLMGDNTVLMAQTPSDQALYLSGNGSAVMDITFNGVGGTRLSNMDSAQIVVTGNNNQIINNDVYGAASAGIFLFGARHFRVAGNRVHNTLADGIHLTNGSNSGLVQKNKVWKTGDDMIAVVSYRDMKDARNVSGLVRNVLIENNEVSDNSWGRGISVVGGENVIIENNAVANIWCCAGILIAQEASYHTFGTHHVLIKHNNVDHVELLPEAPGKHYTEHAAIDMNSSGEMPVDDIQLEDNIVSDSRFSGIRLLGDICKVKISGNNLKNTQGKPLDIINTTCRTTLSCLSNNYQGKELETTSFCPADTGSFTKITLPEEVYWHGCVAH